MKKQKLKVAFKKESQYKIKVVTPKTILFFDTKEPKKTRDKLKVYYNKLKEFHDDDETQAILRLFARFMQAEFFVEGLKIQEKLAKKENDNQGE